MTLRWILSHARGYLELGLVAEAAAELSEVPSSDRESIEYLEVYSTLLQAQQNWNALQIVARVLCNRQPENPSWWVTYAYATRRASCLEEAELILLQAEKLHPEEAIIAFNLGCYACQRGNLELARTRVDRAIVLDPRFQEIAINDSDLEPLRST